MKKILLFICSFYTVGITFAQQPLFIPDTLSGTNINLMIADSSHEFHQGISTATMAYNGSYLGPTIMLNKGDNVTLNVMNMLSDTTTTHWHGLHVAPINDGGPHNPIVPGSVWSPSFNVLDNAATYWYHPHMHGMTMDHVMKGAAGLILVRDATEAALTLPRTYGVDDIPLILQWQNLDTQTKEILMDDDLDNTILVNGMLIEPYQNVPAQVVRLRILNASSHRFFQIGFDDNRTFRQITSDAGLLDASVPMTRLMLGSGERAEILVDFAGQAGSIFHLRQYGTQLPAGYPGGPPDAMGMMTLGPLDNTDMNLLQFNVVAATPNPVTSMPLALTTNVVHSTSGASNFTLAITAQPMMSMTNFFMNGVKFDMSVINMTTTQNSVMKWTITNQSMMPHPLHIHGNHFYVLTINNAAPPLNLRGRKDVVVVPPQNGRVELITRYDNFNDPLIPYMYHCHILSHEDDGMMGQFIVNPDPLGTSDIDTEELIIAYPNPANDYIMLELKDKTQKLNSLDIIDSAGKVVFTKTNPDNTTMVSVQHLNQGLYLLRVRSDNNFITKKFQVSK